MKKEVYCLKCAGEEVKTYSANLCEKHYGEQIKCDRCENLAVVNHQSGIASYAIIGGEYALVPEFNPDDYDNLHLCEKHNEEYLSS